MVYRVKNSQSAWNSFVFMVLWLKNLQLDCQHSETEVEAHKRLRKAVVLIVGKKGLQCVHFQDKPLCWSQDETVVTDNTAVKRWKQLTCFFWDRLQYNNWDIIIMLIVANTGRCWDKLAYIFSSFVSYLFVTSQGQDIHTSSKKSTLFCFIPSKSVLSDLIGIFGVVFFTVVT